MRRLLPLVWTLATLGIAKVLLGGHLLLNITPSIPRGAYWISKSTVPLARGDLVTFPIPASVRELLYSRKYVPRSIELQAKPVAAVGGDHVCIRDGGLFINGELFGKVLPIDGQGRPLPHTSICETLPKDEVFLAPHHDNSFDSRNYGPVSVDRLAGTLTPLLTF